VRIPLCSIVFQSLTLKPLTHIYILFYFSSILKRAALLHRMNILFRLGNMELLS